MNSETQGILARLRNIIPIPIPIAMPAAITITSMSTSTSVSESALHFLLARENARQRFQDAPACVQELFKVAIRSFGKPLKRFEVCAIFQFLAMNREANENKDDWRHPPICYFEHFLRVRACGAVLA